MTANYAIKALGGAAKSYAIPFLSRCKRAAVPAVITSSPESAHSELPSAQVLGSMQALLGLKGALDLDAIAICSPPDDHVVSAIEAMKAGLAVMIEKPAAASREDALTLSIQARTDKRFQVHQSVRFYPAIWTAREVIGEGRLGQIQSIEGKLGHSGPKNLWLRDPKVPGSGIILDLLIHLTDTVRFLTDDDFIQMKLEKLEYQDDDESKVEDRVKVSFVMSEETDGELEASWREEEGENPGYFIITGRKGTLHITFRPYGEQKVEFEPIDAALEAGGKVIIELQKPPYPDAYAYHAACLLGEETIDMGNSVADNLNSLLPLFGLTETGLWTIDHELATLKAVLAGPKN
ncbi:MAG: Gfo/Idh/MocA family oxidoreductase [bacterium]